MAKGKDSVKRDMAVQHLKTALELFHSAIEEMCESTKSLPILDDYVENVFQYIDRETYGIGGIRNVIELLEDHDQEITDAAAIENVL